MEKIKGSILLATVDAFMATAACESYSKAGEALDVSATTVMRQVRALEIWLRRVLILEKEVFPTEYGADFIMTADAVLTLIDKGGLKRELKKTRVHGDGVLTIEGLPLRSHEAREIGRLMVQSRADLSFAKPPPPPAPANDPMLTDFLAKKGF